MCRRSRRATGADGRRGWGLPPVKRGTFPPAPGLTDFRFTTKAGALYAIGLKAPGDGDKAEARLTTFRKGNAKVERVTLLEGGRVLKFRQEEEALVCELPRGLGDLPYALKIEGAMGGFGV